jgi:UDP-glucose 4-epimerase
MNILLTGGLGFIGSHTAVVLSEQGYQVILVDNLCNSEIETHANLELITGKEMPFHELDIRDTTALIRVLKEYQVDAVIHFAGLKSVAESSAEPLKYYDNNVGGTISLLEAMKACDIYHFIFSSSATVYGVPQYLPYDEDHPLVPMNTYGKTKLQAEEILQDVARSDSRWSIAALRYFNPVGAHESGLIGELPKGVPNNLMPYVCQVASGKLPYLNIFGDDYDTKDGTGERDYIHVMDLAEGHVAALRFIEKNIGFYPINLGTGISCSVYELINAFEKSANCTIVKKVQSRRSGDLPIYFACADKAKDLLAWHAKRDLQSMCDSSWKFQANLAKNL